ncbi:MAG: hypothetical protein GXY63_01900, partial [Spirochaetales bacterium]|nr:hypothetical protein [Spirochaetales bacterium]
MKRVAFIIALLCVLSPLAAHEGYYYTLSLSIFPYLSIPHYADDIPMR